MKDKKDFKILFLYPNLMLQTTFPMAIALFSAILKREGYQVDIFDTTFYRTEEVTSDEARVDNLQIAKFNLGKEFQNLPDKNRLILDLKKKVMHFKPDLIAMSVIEDVFLLTVEMVNAIKQWRIPTLAGGIMPTFAPQKLIEVDGIDMVCVGEGEEILSELCDKLRTGKDYSDVKNLWVKQDQEIIKNPMRPVRDLNLNPPPDFELFDDRRFYKPMKGKVYRMGLVETNRGCPYTCRFCNSYSQSTLHQKEVGLSYFRKRDIGDIHDELKILVDKYRVQFIYFPAEVFFAAGMDYLKEFAKMYRKFRIPFFCQNRAEVISGDRLEYLTDMNCHSMALGVEHGNQDFRRKKLKRAVTNETYLNAIKSLEKTDIKVSVNNILGFPDETRELTWDTIRLNRKFNVYQINAYFFTPYHGAELRQECLEKGYIDEEDHPSSVTKDSLLRMPPPFLSQADIRGLVRTFNLYARFPEDRFPEIAVAEKFDDEGNAMFEKLKAEFYRDYLKQAS